MQKEIMTVLLNDDIDIEDIYLSLLPSQKEHCQSVADLTVRLLEWATDDGLYTVTRHQLKKLRQIILYHDIGLALIPKRILAKTEDLTGAEYRVIQRHPAYGASMLDHFRKQSCTPGSHDDLFWSTAAEIALSHHERWDGKGYPYGQSTTGIAFCARAVGIADAFDSIVRGAPYRMPLPQEYALLEIAHNAGRQFDPELAGIFKTHFMDHLCAMGKDGEK